MTAWEERLADLPSVALAQLESEAALLTRVDRKYIVAPAVWADVMAAIPAMRALEIDGARDFGYSSIYFDTPELESYAAAAHRRPSRYKVRIREYLDTGGRSIEVKLRSAKGETVKHREWLPEGRRATGGSTAPPGSLSRASRRSLPRSTASRRCSRRTTDAPRWCSTARA
ncbi:hypothetical protein GCM10025873_23320 [Demequina sediminis]|uniref:VTC domain-containing protein n=1 Tax=Demequina sediminis TaxID=1930058 RepID=UPI00257354B0|nr:VTC domain-containing protein [Demequina sediminis]BDZ62541.1 hypothetical protein GCM10025873_23320 [Demequina sediminis]